MADDPILRARSTGTGVDANKGKRAYDSFNEAIRQKLRDIDIFKENLEASGYKSSKALEGFNTAVEAAKRAVQRLERDIKDPKSKVYGQGTVDPNLRTKIESYRRLGKGVSEIVDITNDIGKALGRLKGSGVGSKAYSAAFQNLSNDYSRGRELIPVGKSSPLGKDVAAIFRGALQQAASELKGARIANFAMGVSSAAAPGYTFSLKGKGTSEAFDTKFAKDQLRDQRSFAQESFRYTQLGPGMYEAQYERMFPSPKLGKNYKYNKSNLPVNIDGGGIGGPPVFNGGGLPGPYMGGLPAFNRGGLPSPYGQTIFATRMGDAGAAAAGGAIGGAYGSGGGLGLLAMLAPFIPEIGAYELGKHAWGAYRAGNNLARPAFPELERLAAGGRVAGRSTAGMMGIASGKGTSLSLNDYWANLGYKSVGDLADVFSAYGSPYMAGSAVTGATKLSQGMFTGFQGPEDWAEFKQKLVGMGIGLSPGGDAAGTSMITKAINTGMKEAMPPQKTFENMEYFLRIIASTGMVVSPERIGQLATMGMGSALPNMRSGEAIGGAMEAYSGTFKNILGNPLAYTQLLSESKRITGTMTPGGREWQKILNAEGAGVKLTSSAMKYLDSVKNSPWAGADYISHASGADANFMGNVRYNNLRTTAHSMGLRGEAATAWVNKWGGILTEDAAKTAFYTKHVGGPGHAKVNYSGTMPASYGSSVDITGAGSLLPYGHTLISGKSGPPMMYDASGRLITGTTLSGTVNPFDLKSGGLSGARLLGASDLSNTLELANTDLKTFGGLIENLNTSLNSLLIMFESYGFGSPASLPPGKSYPPASTGGAAGGPPGRPWYLPGVPPPP
jgi:hypothetical protein